MRERARTQERQTDEYSKSFISAIFGAILIVYRMNTILSQPDSGQRLSHCSDVTGVRNPIMDDNIALLPFSGCAKPSLR